MASFWPKICIKSICGRGEEPRIPLVELTTLPRTHSRIVRGHLSPRFLPLDGFGVSISRHTKWGWWGPAIMFSRAPRWLSTGLLNTLDTKLQIIQSSKDSEALKTPLLFPAFNIVFRLRLVFFPFGNSVWWASLYLAPFSVFINYCNTLPVTGQCADSAVSK